MMQMERTTAALMAHLKLHNTAASKLDLLGELIAARPDISAIGLRCAMEKAEINPATKECADKWLASEGIAPIPARETPKPTSNEPKVEPEATATPATKPKAASKPKPPKTESDAPMASATEPAGSD